MARFRGESWSEVGAEPVGFQFGMNDPLAQHDDAPRVTLFTGGGEVEHEAAPDSQTAAFVSLEPESAKEHGIVQQHNVHGLAVVLGGLQNRVLDGLASPPVPDDEAGQKQPEKIAQRHAGAHDEAGLALS